MSMDQAHAGMRAGMEIGDKLRGNVTVLAGVGVGAHESAALVLSRLTDSPVRDLVVTGPEMSAEHLAHLMVVLQAPRAGTASRRADRGAGRLWRLRSGVMVGVMLMAASKRHLLIVDGVPACAALMLARASRRRSPTTACSAAATATAAWTRR
jgi:nicotinate-nucleotide--dimethylbenzimidazole phosphoribosyltransferase